MSPDFYSLLGVAVGASQQDIDRAYAASKAKLQQTAGNGRDADPGASRALEAAYGVLRDPVKRKAYDRIRSREASVAPAPQTAQSAPERSIGEVVPPASPLRRLWRGEFSPGWIFLLLILLPFVGSIYLPEGPLWVKLLPNLWFVIAAILLWRCAFRVQRRFWGYLTRTFVVLMLAYQAVVVPVVVTLYQSPPGSMASGSAGTEGCVNVEAQILQAVTGDRAARPEEVEFRQSREGQYLAAALAGRIDDVKRLLDEGADIAAREKGRQHWDNSALDHAARTDNVSLAQLLLARGFDINARSTGGHTALHVASGLGRVRMAEFLLKRGADVSLRDSSAGTPLEVTVVQARPTMARLLVKHGASTGGDGRASPLQAIRNVGSLCNGHLEVIRFLGAGARNLFVQDDKGDSAAVALAWKGDDTAMILAKEFPTLDWTTLVPWDKRQVPLLMVAACAPRSSGTVAYLLTAHPQKERWRASVSGPWGSLLHCASEIKLGHWSETAIGLISDVNVRDAKGQTVLHRAANPQFVQALIAKGADINAQDAAGQTALMLRTHVHETAKVLIERGADLSIRDARGSTVLHKVASENSMPLAKLLVERKVDVNAVDASGRTALHFLRSGEMAELLVSAGADMDARGTDGRTALHEAAARGEVEAARVLLGKGADPLARAMDGSTPIHDATRNARGEVLKALLAVKFQGVNAVDSNGRSPLHYASGQGYTAVLNELIEKGARLDLADRYGNTPLHLATLVGNAYTTGFLVKAGADPKIRNKDGKTPFDLAMQSTKSEELLKALRGEFEAVRRSRDTLRDRSR